MRYGHCEHWLALCAVVGALACGGSPGYTISGRISGAGSGTPTIILSSGSSPDRSTSTDRDGVFAFAGVPDGSYTVTAFAAGYGIHPATRVVTVQGADVAAMDFECHTLLEVYGTDMGPLYQNIGVLQRGAGVSDAEVKVNGEIVPFSGRTDIDGVYIGPLTSPLPPGATLVLEVARGASSVTAVGTIPEAPFLTAPGGGTVFAPTDDVPVNWSSLTDPDRFTVNAQWSCGPVCGTGVRFDVPGSARSYTIHAGSIPSGQITLSVFAYNSGTFSGDFAPHRLYPGMNIRGEQGTITITH